MTENRWVFLGTNSSKVFELVEGDYISLERNEIFGFWENDGHLVVNLDRSSSVLVRIDAQFDEFLTFVESNKADSINQSCAGG